DPHLLRVARNAPISQARHWREFRNQLASPPNDLLARHDEFARETVQCRLVNNRTLQQCIARSQSPRVALEQRQIPRVRLRQNQIDKSPPTSCSALNELKVF